MNNQMFDCHSHILFGVDDGAKTIEDSAHMLTKLKKMGFKSIILTPHFDRTYHSTLTKRQNNFDKLVPIAKKIGINIYLSNEVHLTNDITKNFSEFSLIGNHIFLEFSLTNRRANFVQCLHDLDAKGLKIVLVHPERYEYLANYEYQELHDYGLKFQVNYASIVGFYGAEAKKRAKFLFENNLVDFLGTDIHFDSFRFYRALKKSFIKIPKLIGEKAFIKISSQNPLSLFEQESVTTQSIKQTWRTTPTVRKSTTKATVTPAKTKATITPAKTKSAAPKAKTTLTTKPTTTSTKPRRRKKIIQ